MALVKEGFHEPLSLGNGWQNYGYWLWMEMALKCQLTVHVWVLAQFFGERCLVNLFSHLPSVPFLPLTLPSSPQTSSSVPPLHSCSIVSYFLSFHLFVLHFVVTNMPSWFFSALTFLTKLYQDHTLSSKLLSSHSSDPSSLNFWVIWLLLSTKKCMQITFCGKQASEKRTVQGNILLLLLNASPNCSSSKIYPPRLTPFDPEVLP